MKLTSYESAAEFLAVAEPELLRDEAKNNLILGIAGRVRGGRSYGDRPPVFVTVDAKGELIAAAIRTPPHPLIVHCADGRHDALDPLVDHLLSADPGLPGVNGEAPTAAAFARRWMERSNVRSRLGMQMSIYALHEVDHPVGVPGRMRLAREEDVDLLAGWMLRFYEEAVPDDPPIDPAQTVRRFMESGAMAVWDHEGVVSMAGSSRGTANGATVSAVYTPSGNRGNGYASACVAGLCGLLLERGSAFCTLYADLSNPTSNKIYQRIGFRLVSESAVYRFAPEGDT
jgi:predicted GNAT family acetyltransferase